MTNTAPGARTLSILLLAIWLTACGGGGGGSAPPPGNNAGSWTISASDVVDAGPGKDGIPAIDNPVFQAASANTDLNPFDRVIGVFHGGEYRAFPHEILNWHEVVNDAVQFDPYVLSYCPLTGSAVAWDIDTGANNPEFGVSGLLYNSNLILYDRETDSRWSQMLERSVQGGRVGEQPERMQLLETTWETWLQMFPNSLVLTRSTGHNREYGQYPYQNYRTDSQLLFPVIREDNRLHPKTRVLGIRSDTGSKVYQISEFGSSTQTINDQFENQPIVVVGNGTKDFAVIFSRELSDGTILTFSPLDGQLPNVMQDTEGNIWNVFGRAVSGPRADTQLRKTRSYTAMWFAWAAFFDNTAIHF